LPIGRQLGNAHQVIDRNEIVQTSTPLRRIIAVPRPAPCEATSPGLLPQILSGLEH
jgi:hypothetical protein